MGEGLYTDRCSSCKTKARVTPQSNVKELRLEQGCGYIQKGGMVIYRLIKKIQVSV